MTFLTRLKYLFGMLLVLGVVAALLVGLDSRISTVQDVSATVRSREYSLGTDYSGVIVKKSVHVGQRVRTGDKLFVVKSNDLARDVADDAVNPARSPYDIRHHNQLVVRATAPGKVVKVNHIEGSFVPVNTKLARIQVRGSSFVQADFRLTPTQYAAMRGARSMTVTLPNHRQVEADITRVTVRTAGDRAETRVRARAPQLSNHGLFTTGSPVDAQVRLRDNGLVHSAKTALTGLLTPGGSP